MDNIIQKLTSRKFWLAIAGVATGVAMALGVDATEISSVAGAVVALFSCVTFIMVEGKIDAEAVKIAVESTQEAVTVIQEEPAEHHETVVTGFGGDQ